MLTNPLTDPYESFPRYLYRYYREGTLHSERAANARDECRKIKSVMRLATEVSFISCLSCTKVNVHVFLAHRRRHREN